MEHVASELLSDPQDAWISMLSRDRLDVMLTLGFRSSLPFDFAVSTLGHFLARINSDLFGKAWYKHGPCLTGFVILERKHLSRRARGSPHFHCCMSWPKGQGAADVDNLRMSARHHAPRLRRPTGNWQISMGDRISGANLVDVRPIYDQRGLTEYLTKEFPYQTIATRGYTVGFIGFDGVIGLTTTQEIAMAGYSR